ncbi:DUF397 domain-containing protein [Streptomyces abikoensis]|uniref:DUF397 domain-containing protein n=1 Tax=Streptomyces abikoensis TaxID=97398 RepID=UPI001675FBA2|nr:DUF397 domain-containing protein [Streptomyces abikoensis]GGP56938.1 hypothetical protein GCM10010214_32980 [Streptomyces abikoensis]
MALNWQKSSYSEEASSCIYLAAGQAWQKSTYSEYGSSCIYVSPALTGTIHLRESDDPDVILTTTPARLRPLITRIKAGALTPTPDRADP